MNKKSIIKVILLTLVIVFVGLGINYYKDIYNYFTREIQQNKPAATENLSDIQQANELFEQNRYEESFTYYQHAIQSQIDLAEAYSGLGNISMKWRRYDDAAGYYTASLNLKQDSNVLANRCNAYRFLAKFNDAEQDCSLSIQLNPDNINGYETLAMLQMDNKDLIAARETINKAFTINQNSADLHYASAQIYTAEGNLEDAIKEFSNCINIDPNALICYWERGFDYYMNGKIDLAKEDMRSILAKGNPDSDGELLYKAGNLLDMLGGNP